MDFLTGELSVLERVLSTFLAGAGAIIGYLYRDNTNLRTKHYEELAERNRRNEEKLERLERLQSERKPGP